MDRAKQKAGIVKWLFLSYLKEHTPRAMSYAWDRLDADLV